MTLGSGHRDGISQSGLGGGTLSKRISNGPQGGGIGYGGGVRIVALETGSQLVGVVEDLFETTRHGLHLRYLGRATMACTITGPSVEETTPIS